jgi:hypothetical protein
MYKTNSSPPQIFGIGLSKTATTSLNKALNILGYKSVHFPPNLLKIKDGTFNSATDTTIALNYLELKNIYPQSKFICTLRNKREWLVSIEEHLTTGRGLKHGNVDFVKELRLHLYGSTTFEEEKYAKAFNRHICQVMDDFNKDMSRLKFVNLIESDSPWEDICGFLNCTVPDIAFPHLNKKKTYLGEQNEDQLKRCSSL